MGASERELRAGLDRLALGVTDGQVDQLLRFADLLQKWTRVYNLTALRGPEEIITHHLLDCAAVIGPLRRVIPDKGRRLLDVGSGGGLPGVVIATILPDCTVDCVDAVAKKAAFVQQVSASLGLPNLRGIHSRVEQLEGRYDIVASRAFASLADFVSLSSAALAADGVWMAMKGKYPGDEVATLPAEVEVFHVEQLEVPGLVADRHLLWLRRRRA